MILTLQCCPLDSAQAIELVRLLCDIEPIKTLHHEFCVAARGDTPLDHIHAMVQLAQTKFAAVHVIQGKRAGRGWPEGPNDLWAETMMRLSLLRKGRKTEQTVALTFEADCVPLRADWLVALAMAWAQADAPGKHVLGHAHGEPPDHINGNAMFRIGLLRHYPQLNSSNNRRGWDHFHGELLLGMGTDTDLITQTYNLREYNRGALEGIRKNGVIPALHHGAKGMEAIRIVRAMHEDGTLQKRAGGPVGGLRSYQYMAPPPKKETPQPAPKEAAEPEKPGDFSGSE